MGGGGGRRRGRRWWEDEAGVGERRWLKCTWRAAAEGSGGSAVAGQRDVGGDDSSSDRGFNGER